MYKKCENILNKLQEDGKIKIFDFTFPQKQPLKLKLKDLLEDKVDEKYYLSDEQVNRIKSSSFNQANTRIQEKEYRDTLCARDWKDPKCVEVIGKYGIFDTEKSTHQAGSVYDENGLSSTLDTMQGGYRQPCVEVKDTIYSNESVKRIKSNIIKGDVANTLTANAMQSFNHNNCALIEEGYVEKKYREFIDENGYIPEMYNPYNNSEIKDIAPTQSTQCGSTTSSATVLKVVNNKPICLNSKGGRNGIDGVQPSRKDRVYDSTSIAATIATSDFYNPNYTDNLRIRKLTTKECFRLMGFDDEDFEKAAFKKETLYIEGGLKCSAKLKIVNEKQRHLDMETYALCTTNDTFDMETQTQTKWKKNIENEKLERMQNVSIVIEMLDELVQKECVINTIKCTDYTMTPCILMDELDQHQMAIIELEKKDNMNIGKYMKIILEENLDITKLYIISTLIEQIIKSRIYTYITQKASIKGNISIIEDYAKNSKKMKLLNLKMEYITRLNSNSMLYKQAGNSIVVNVLEAIFKELFKDYIPSEDKWSDLD